MTKLECGTPRAIVSRWLAYLKSGKEVEDERIGDRRRRKGRCGGGEDLRVNCSTKCLNEESVTEPNIGCKCGPPIVEGSMKSKNEVELNLGAGFGLAFLMASSKYELHKMMELRKQMESILKSAKDDLQSVVDKVSKSSKVRGTMDYSTTDVEESMNSNGYFSHTDYTPSEQRLPLTQDPHRKDMEIELESELKHLQLLSESDDLQNEHDGVEPEELALRLHELLESRQEERIKELEAALTETLRKLDEKQSEVLWWKETAQLFSQRLPETSNTSSSSSSSSSFRVKSPQRSKRSVRLAEKFSTEILMNP